MSHQPIVAGLTRVRVRLLGLLTMLILGCEASPITTPDAGIENDAGSPVAGAGTVDAGGPLWPVAALKMEATRRGGFPTPDCRTDAGMIDGSTFSLMMDDGSTMSSASSSFPGRPRRSSRAV